MSGSTAIAVGETVTILDGLNNEDICVTVANTGKDPVRLDLIDAGATSVDVAVGATVRRTRWTWPTRARRAARSPGGPTRSSPWGTDPRGGEAAVRCCTLPRGGERCACAGRWP